MNQEEYQEYLKEREILRPIDAKIAKLMGKEVACLSGYWDPESGHFSPHMPDEYGGDEDKIIILDKAYHEAVKTNQNIRGQRGKAREEGIDLLEPLDYCDLREVEWTASISDTGVGKGVEFCSPRQKGDKKWWWEEIPHYTTNAEDFKEVENYILKKSDELCKPIRTSHGIEMELTYLNKYLWGVKDVTGEFDSGRALLVATCRQKADAAIPVLEELAG